MLQIWDKIYHKNTWGLNNDTPRFYFEEIERITKTLIITKSWERLKNFWDYALKIFDKRPSEKYTLVTEEALKEYEESKYNSKVNNWFYETKFSLDEKKKIYELLK